MTPLERVLYVSQAVQPLAVDQVRALVGGAHIRNRRNDVTGALLFTGRAFAQVIEARTPVIDELLARIGRDPRHTRMHVVWRQPVQRRHYERWGMAAIFSEGADALIRELATGPAPAGDAIDAVLDRLFEPDALTAY